MLTWVNLTPHKINILMPDGSMVSVDPSGTVARCAVTRQQHMTLDIAMTPIPIYRASYGAVSDLPDYAPGRCYIVSSLVAQACAGRRDLFIPDDTVRDAAGRIIGCRALAQI